MAKDNTAVVWFRQDLRVHDNEALTEAIATGKQVIPVYVFDKRLYSGRTLNSFPKVGPVRAKFITDSIKALRKALHNIGLPLMVRTGMTEEVIFNICTEFNVHYVFCNRERTREEVLIQDSLEKKLWTRGMEIRYSRGKMLYYTADLPFPVTHTPDSFNAFRKEVEPIVTIRKALPVPEKQLNSWVHLIDEGPIPGLIDFGFSQNEINSHVYLLDGGEEKALAQLNYFICQTDRNQHTNNTFLSPYLSQGCISPKFLYWTYYENIKHEENNFHDKDVYLKLLKRDHYRLMGKKYGESIFNINGVRSKLTKQNTRNQELLCAWVNGMTGIPAIDANMNKLKKTGCLDFTSRVICARFFVEELKLDWTIGAAYFESALIDYDPCSNWVHWMNIAGVGMERFDQRPINYQELYKSKDKDGAYLAKWLPALSNLPPEFRHWPSSAEEKQLKSLNFELGKDYPMPII